jgi:hypothetical protein
MDWKERASWVLEKGIPLSITYASGDTTSYERLNLGDISMMLLATMPNTQS